MSTSTRQSSWFERFMASGYGRLLRAAFGLSIIAAALTLLDGTLAFAVAALGIIPIAAGVFGLCPIAPLWGGHFVGARYCAGQTNKQS